MPQIVVLTIKTSTIMKIALVTFFTINGTRAIIEHVIPELLKKGAGTTVTGSDENADDTQ
jgi:hypothetical protein